MIEVESKIEHKKIANHKLRDETKVQSRITHTEDGNHKTRECWRKKRIWSQRTRDVQVNANVFPFYGVHGQIPPICDLKYQRDVLLFFLQILKIRNPHI